MDDKLTYFEYLDKLREIGVTNMLGATPYLRKTFALSQEEALSVLKEWTETFKARHKLGR